MGDAELLILVNLSCLVRKVQENESDSWLPIQEWLLKLRRKGAGKAIGFKEAGASKMSSLSTELTPQVSSLSAELTPQISSLSTELKVLSMEFLGIPSDLKQELEQLGLRASEKKVKSLILKICALKSFKLPEIAFLLRRNANYIRENYLMPLIKTEELKYLFPHQPNHPQQAYKTKS